ncbi:MAG: methylated-DNA--[protein]-cysteine S-methyltransferase [Alphaproteobacteria bacterium]|nr:MAG: methylated-DNA--[protein]-cysteine S-methyltransferase [Alphaproteobacteria bacterium]
MKTQIIEWQTLKTPVCPLAFAWNRTGLVAVSFDEKPSHLRAHVERHGLGAFSERATSGSAYETAFLRYFDGDLNAFDKIQVAPVGTAFNMAVWAALQEIPCGQTRTYGELAEGLGNKGAARAVGLACNRNPIAIVIPCHRVVGSSGKLTGFAGGLDVKAWLLTHEGVRTENKQYQLL